MVRPDRWYAAEAQELAEPQVFVFPAEADVTNSGALGRDLLSALRPGACVVIADLSVTEFCDTAAIRDLIIANNQAACIGAELRVVLCSLAVRRVMEVLGADQMLKLYPDLPSALARAPRTD